MAPVLGYWDLRGLAQAIRLLLEHAGVEYEEKIYTFGPPPEFDRSEWLNEKFTLGLDFPNLPYYIDGDVKLTQSHAILRYLARKHNLAGKNNAEMARADMLAAQVYDYHKEHIRGVAYNPEFLKVVGAYLKELPTKLKLLSDFLGENKYALGENVSYADFVLFEFLEVQLLHDPKLLEDYQPLKNFHQNMSKLESVERYFNSPKAIKYPFYATPALIGGLYSKELLEQKK